MFEGLFVVDFGFLVDVYLEVDHAEKLMGVEVGGHEGCYVVDVGYCFFVGHFLFFVGFLDFSFFFLVSFFLKNIKNNLVYKTTQIAHKRINRNKYFTTN